MVVFLVGFNPIEVVDNFNYLGRFLVMLDKYLPELLSNLGKVRKCWRLFGGGLCNRDIGNQGIWDVLWCISSGYPILWVKDVDSGLPHDHCLIGITNGVFQRNRNN